MSHKNIWKPGDIITTKKWNNISNCGLFFPQKIIQGSGCIDYDNNEISENGKYTPTSLFLYITKEELDKLFENDNMNYCIYIPFKVDNEIKYYGIGFIVQGDQEGYGKYYNLYDNDGNPTGLALENSLNYYGDNYMHVYYPENVA